MRRRVQCVLSVRWITVVALGGALAFAPSIVAQTLKESLPQAESLKVFLQKYLGEPDPGFEKEASTRYSSAFVDLKDDGTKEFIVYVSGRGWCGTGGCVMLILAPEGESYKVVTRTMVTRLPIRVLTTKSNGWHDISVVVAGGRIQPGYEAELSFDGKTYPSNPTVSPARRLTGKARGETAITETTKDQALY
jgi:hypothetical protein